MAFLDPLPNPNIVYLTSDHLYNRRSPLVQQLPATAQVEVAHLALDPSGRGFAARPQAWPVKVRHRPHDNERGRAGLKLARTIVRFYDA